MCRTALLVFILTFPAIATDQQSVMPLERGKPIERELAGGETHWYSIALGTGEFLRAVFDQRRIDIVVTAYGPDQKKIVDVDSPNGAEGPEPLELIASAAGTYRIEVRAFAKDAKPGRYEARVDVLMSAEEYAAHLAAERALAEEAAKEIARVAAALRTAEPGHGFEDLQPLRRVVGTAHLVTLGQATHGTREFFQLNHRILEFLVTKMGFTVFGIEATMPEAFDINDYILTGQGDPLKALSALYYWAWNTEEMLGTIEWMRHYNADPGHPKKVKFYGFDMEHPVRAVKVTLDYLRTVDPKMAAEASKALEVLANPFTSGDFDKFAPERKQATLAAIRRIVARFDERKQAYVERTSPTAWALARQHAQVAAQYIESRTDDPTGSVRNRSMAENIRWIVEHEGSATRMIACAHNDHVATDANEMGTFLRKKFDKDMVVFGSAFNQGSFQAFEPGKGLHSFTVPAAPAGSFDSILASSHLPLAMIDFRSLPAGSALAKWLSEPRVTRDISAVYHDSNANDVLVKRAIRDRYDGVIFVNQTTAARPIPGVRVIGRAEPLPMPANLDFEDGEANGSPQKWIVLPPTPGNFDFEITTSDENARSGRRAAVIRRMPGKHYGEMSGSLLQQLDAKTYRGKRIRLRASAKSHGDGNRTFLWLKVWGASEERRVVTNRDWEEYELTVNVPITATLIDYGLALTGDGEAWIDAVALEVVETPANSSWQ